MIRTIEELVQPSILMGQPAKVMGLGTGSVVNEEQFYGWAPDVNILNESDLKKVEK